MPRYARSWKPPQSLKALEPLVDIAEAIEATGRIVYKGRTYLIVDAVTGMPSHLVGK